MNRQLLAHQRTEDQLKAAQVQLQKEEKERQVSFSKDLEEGLQQIHGGPVCRKTKRFFS